VSLRACHPLHCVAVLAIGAIVAVGMFVGAPAAGAQGQSASFVAGDDFWTRTAGVGSSATNALIFTGGTVSFSDPPGSVRPHNVDFTGGSDPSSCTGIPASPSNTGWNGSCSFNSPGSFSFVCEAHSNMTGTVDVVDPPPGGNPPPPPPGGGGNPPSGGGGSGGDPGGSPTQPGAAKISFARKQTGTRLRGSVTAPADAKIVVTAFVSNRYLSTKRPERIKKVRVGSQTKRSTGSKVNFAVKLKAAARRALKNRGKLPVSLRITVTPPGGQATTKTAKVTLRPA
jgi:plastocyanin